MAYLRTTYNGGNNYKPSWSPNGKWIIYISEKDGDTEILMTDLDGKNQRRLAYNFAIDRLSVWTPEIK